MTQQPPPYGGHQLPNQPSSQPPVKAWWRRPRVWIIAVIAVAGIAGTLDPADEPEPTPTATATTASTTPVEDATTISHADAQTLCEDAGTEAYPYGFRVHWSGGRDVNATRDDGTLLLRYDVTLTDEAGNRTDATMECLIGGTPEAPEITEFSVY